MGNAKSGNATTIGKIVAVDLDRLTENYLRMQDALKAIAEMPANTPPAMAALRMRALAKAGLG